MPSEDPFGLFDDKGRTRIRPAASAGYAPAAPAAGVTRRLRSHPNVLVNVFAKLLEVAPELEAALAPGDAEVLRTRLMGELATARDAAVSAGVTMARAE